MWKLDEVDRRSDILYACETGWQHYRHSEKRSSPAGVQAWSGDVQYGHTVPAGNGKMCGSAHKGITLDTKSGLDIRGLGKGSWKDMDLYAQEGAL
jgi:hypothetical protein